MGFIDALNKLMGREGGAEKLYKELNTESYQSYPFETEDLHEGMAVVNEVLGEYWKPRFLLDHRAQRAYEFMSKDETLLTVTRDDVDWHSLENINDENVIERARQLDFHFPSFVLKFENGVAEVRLQLNPDGMYYMDEDGYGMPDDEEVDIYGFIDRTGRVLVKFRYIDDDDDDVLDEMRAEAEQKAKLSKNGE